MNTNNVNTPARNDDLDIKKPMFLKVITPSDKDGKPGFIQYILGNGKTLELDLKRVSEVNKIRGMHQGLKKKVADTCANLSKDERYTDAFSAMDEMIQRMYTEEWNKPGQGGGESTQSIQDLVQAICKVQNAKVEEVLPIIEAATPEQRKTWRQHPQVDVELQSIRLKRKQAQLKQSQAGAFEFPLK